MNWIKDRIKKFGESLKRYTRKRPSKNEQENADWINCPSCKKLQYKKDLLGAHFICSCNYHFDYPAKLRLRNLIFDNGSYENTINWGQGNLDNNPRFMDSDNQDYRLSDISPANAQILSVIAVAKSKVPSLEPVGVKGSPSVPAVRAGVNVAAPLT
mgnify:CR=1 FL=1